MALGFLNHVDLRTRDLTISRVPQNTLPDCAEHYQWTAVQ